MTPLFNLVGTNTWCVRFTADRRIEINPEYTAEGAAADFVRIVHEMAGKSATPTPVPGVSEGMVLVPRKPTVAMLKAAADEWSRVRNAHNSEAVGSDYWRAMIEAAVQSPPAGGRVKALLDCLHHANPSDTSHWHVKPGMHIAFSKAVDALSLAAPVEAVATEPVADDLEARAWECGKWPTWLHNIVERTNEVADRLDMSTEQAIAYAVLSTGDSGALREALEAVVAASRKVLANLNARIEQAAERGDPVPVFDGIAELDAALAGVNTDD